MCSDPAGSCLALNEMSRRNGNVSLQIWRAGNIILGILCNKTFDYISLSLIYFLFIIPKFDELPAGDVYTQLYLFFL